ncbi:SAF domain-containing protein [Lipingzhangella sp. LS1_29]|uniref:SAF domain-containing protein n=1 Tax=Lipingzhangella rawalii TaxID=2055835 RepID=A0ABU2H662_9ACTN|nr:SAF domain-containing protein [Lipingzhangella rawalii]MDS1270345.1 SAF domain-containing protein [Lipingzhangella rawalii]
MPESIVPRTPRGFRLARWLARWRRLLSGACVALAVTGAVLAVRPPDEPTVEVVVAATDLTASTPLTGDDLSTRELPSAHRPDGAVDEVAAITGAHLTGPVRRGEVLTSARIAEDAAAEYGDDLVAAPVRIADSGVLDILTPGSRVDVLGRAASEELAMGFGGAAEAQVVVADRPVLALPNQGDTFGPAGALILVAVSADEAQRLAGYPDPGQLSITIRS